MIYFDEHYLVFTFITNDRIRFNHMFALYTLIVANTEHALLGNLQVQRAR